MTQVADIPIDLIDLDPDQPRKTIERAKIEEMTHSLKRFGQLVPVLVSPRGQRFLMFEGECRLRGARLAQLATLKGIILDEAATPQSRFAAQLIANCVRNDLNPMDRMRAYQQLMEQNQWNATELAKNLAVSKGNVTRYLSHAELSPELQAKLESGELSSVKAYAIARREAEKNEPLASGPPNASATQTSPPAGDVLPKARLQQIRLVLPECSLALSSSTSLNVDTLIESLTELIRACKKARSQKLDISTLAAVLRDKAAAARETGELHV